MAEGGDAHAGEDEPASMQVDNGDYLPAELLSVSIIALRMSCRHKLGLYLNLDALPLPQGYLPNYQGIAELVGFEFIEQKSFERAKDPTAELLHEWGNRPELEPTIGKLVEYLAQLGRDDVLVDCRDIIRSDAENYLRRLRERSEIKPVQDATVSQSPYDINDMDVDETAIMTIQDVESGEKTYYDAFVCYHPEGEDLKFVKAMIDRVECEPHNIRLFIPHRDDLPGASKHVISAKLIQDRCKRMVIVMSPRYLQSDACDFQTKFAHALSPGSRSKKLVPVMVNFCPTPNILRHVTMCDYTRGDMTGWFWKRLISSLKAPLVPGEICVEKPEKLTDLEMNVDSDADPGFNKPPLPPQQQAAAPGASSVLANSASKTSASAATTTVLAAASRLQPTPPPPYTATATEPCLGRNSPTASAGDAASALGLCGTDAPAKSSTEMTVRRSPVPGGGGGGGGLSSSPLSSSPSSSSPSSPNTKRKGGKFKNKLKNMFSSSSSNASHS